MIYLWTNLSHSTFFSALHVVTCMNSMLHFKTTHQNSPSCNFASYPSLKWASLLHHHTDIHIIHIVTHGAFPMLRSGSIGPCTSLPTRTPSPTHTHLDILLDTPGRASISLHFPGQAYVITPPPPGINTKHIFPIPFSVICRGVWLNNGIAQ